MLVYHHEASDIYFSSTTIKQSIYTLNLCQTYLLMVLPIHGKYSHNDTHERIHPRIIPSRQHMLRKMENFFQNNDVRSNAFLLIYTYEIPLRLQSKHGGVTSLQIQTIIIIEWNRLKLQSDLFLSLYRSPQRHLNLLAYASIFGKVEFNTTTLIPPGIYVLVNKIPPQY